MKISYTKHQAEAKSYGYSELQSFKKNYEFLASLSYINNDYTTCTVKHFVSMRIAFIILASMLGMFSIGQARAEISDVIKRSLVIVDGPTGSGTGVVIGAKGNSYIFLTVKHAMGLDSEENNIRDDDGSTRRIKVLKRFEGKDLLVGSFNSTQKYIPAIINSYMSFAPTNLGNMVSKLNTVTNRGIVAGYSMPTELINMPLLRVVDISFIGMAKGLKNGYNLLYQASTVPGMSGGSVLGFRDCWMGGGYPMGISEKSLFPVLVGIHGQSENYPNENFRSGVSMGIPIDKTITDYLTSISREGGIPANANQMEEIVTDVYCTR